MCQILFKYVINPLANILLRNEKFIKAIDFFIDGASLFTRLVGKLFVILVFILTSLVLTSYYFCILPYYIDNRNEFLTLLNIILGHYLLINIIFHYINAVKTNPGFVLNTPQVAEKDVKYYRNNYNQRICKHCCQVKPPRAYHCSICRKCVIKMEHHCPWINNCVGVMNHKFYLLFCWFMWLGTIYILLSSWPLFKNIYKTKLRSNSYNKKHKLTAYTNQLIQQNKDENILIWLNSYFMIANGDYKDDFPENSDTQVDDPLQDILENDSQIQQSMFYSNFSWYLKILNGYYFKHVVIFSFVICLSVAIALCILTCWQTWLVFYGETSVERMKSMSERAECRRRKLKYNSPYHYGYLKNWQKLLGFNDWHSFLWHVILPSKNRGSYHTENLQYVEYDEERLL